MTTHTYISLYNIHCKCV